MKHETGLKQGTLYVTLPQRRRHVYRFADQYNPFSSPDRVVNFPNETALLYIGHSVYKGEWLACLSCEGLVWVHVGEIEKVTT